MSFFLPLARLFYQHDQIKTLTCWVSQVSAVALHLGRSMTSLRTVNLTALSATLANANVRTVLLCVRVSVSVSVSVGVGVGVVCVVVCGCVWLCVVVCVLVCV